MKRILVVYNTCGLSGRENSEYYIKAISSVLEQDFASFDVVVSSCMNKQFTQNRLWQTFGGKVMYSLVNEIHPVNVTFNHAINQVVRRRGEYASYFYMDSGTNMIGQPEVLKKANRLMLEGKYGMVTPQPANDTEYFGGLGVGRHRGDDDYAREILFKEGDYIIPEGKGMGTHTNLISNELRAFYGNVYPDIFASHCTESTFSFMNAGLKLQWLLMKDIILEHEISMDGQSSGFSPLKWQQSGGKTFDHPYVIPSILDRVNTYESWDVGFGYEECRDILQHRVECFDDNHLCVNDNLKIWIKDNLFLKKEEFDYEGINHQYID